MSGSSTSTAASEPVLRPAKPDRRDPLIGRFTTADPVAAQPYDTQGFDRYAYVGNNPLAFTDPNGFCGFFCILGHIFNPVQQFNDFIAVVKAVNSVPILGQAINIASVAVSAYFCGPCSIGVAAANASLVAGVESGDLGQAFKAGLITGAESAAFYGAGNISNYALNIAAHAAIACVSAAAEGGDCGPQALAGGLSAAAAPIINAEFPDPIHNPGNLIGGTIVSATIGGVGSVAGGGKFENGAVTAAFGYIVNNALHAFSHEYEYSREICQTSEGSCTTKAVWDQLLRNDYPGQPAGTTVQNGGRYSVLDAKSLGAIIVYVDPDSYTVTNVTQASHIFCCGFVSQSVIENGGEIDIHVHGVGTNGPSLLPWITSTVNFAAGYAAFSETHAHIREAIDRLKPAVQ